MDTHFTAAVTEWQGFYALVGEASATLMGLIFVAVSIQLDVFTGGGVASLFVDARRTFSRFIIVLIIALVFEVPEQSPYGLGIPLLILGVLDMRNTLRVVLTTWRHPQQPCTDAMAVRGRSITPLLPLISGSGICVIAIMLLLGSTAGLNWLVGAIAVILANAAEESWDLMFTLAKAAAGKATNPAPSAGLSSHPAVPEQGDQAGSEV